MKNSEIEKRFNEIADKDTKLDQVERNSLLSLYENLAYEVELELTQETIMASDLKICGAIEYLKGIDKIDDDEGLYMLINEIERGA